jgi:hypothetical protein
MPSSASTTATAAGKIIMGENKKVASRRAA